MSKPARQSFIVLLPFVHILARTHIHARILCETLTDIYYIAEAHTV